MRYAGVLLLLLSIGAKAAPPQQKADLLWDHLTAKVSEVEHGLDGVIGVAILDLASGKQYLLHPDEVFPQASSIKIAVLAELYHQVDQGKLKLTDRYVVEAKDLVQDSDIMGGLTPGVTTLTIKDLATMMVAVSDNSATNVLIDKVGMANVRALTDSLGLPNTQLRRKMMDLKAAAEGRENISTPREMMTLLEKIYRGKVLGAETKDAFFAMLATHKFSQIMRAVPPDIMVADKPGELEGVRTDSGIVFLKDRPFVISVMTTYLGSESAGEEAIIKITHAAYEMFDRIGRASDLGRVISVGNGNIR